MNQVKSSQALVFGHFDEFKPKHLFLGLVRARTKFEYSIVDKVWLI